MTYGQGAYGSAPYGGEESATAAISVEPLCPSLSIETKGPNHIVEATTAPATITATDLTPYPKQASLTVSSYGLPSVATPTVPSLTLVAASMESTPSVPSISIVSRGVQPFEVEATAAVMVIRAHHALQADLPFMVLNGSQAMTKNTVLLGSEVMNG